MANEAILSVIPDDPMHRLPLALQQTIQAGMPFCDVHTHIFNFQDVPDKYIGIRLPMNQRFLAKLYKILHNIIPQTDTDSLSMTAYFIQVFRENSMEEIFNRMRTYYSDNDLFVVLMMDMAKGIEGKIGHSIRQQMDILADVRDKFPTKLLPFVAIDPRREDALQLFKDAFDKNGKYKFFGLKVYPSLGYVPSHPRLMEMYAICEEKQIPVLAHCSGATVHSSHKRIKNIEGTKYNAKGEEIKKKENKWFWSKDSYARYFNHPRNWGPVMRDFPDLRLNLAHFGGPAQWEKFLKDKPDSWVPRMLDLINRYEHLYVDFSYTMYKDAYVHKLRQMMEDNRKIRERVLFGSDYYMIVKEGHYRDLLADFRTRVGDTLMEQMAVTNNRRYLFG